MAGVIQHVSICSVLYQFERMSGWLIIARACAISAHDVPVFGLCWQLVVI